MGACPRSLNRFHRAGSSFSFAASPSPLPFGPQFESRVSASRCPSGGTLPEESEALFDVWVLVVDLECIDGPVMDLRLIPPRPPSASPKGLRWLTEQGTLQCLQHPFYT